MSTTQDLMQDLQRGKISRREFMVRALVLGVSLSGVEAILQSCGGGGGSGSSIKWSNWANTGEIQRFKDFTANYNKTHSTNIQYTFVPTANGNYPRDAQRDFSKRAEKSKAELGGEQV